MFNGPNVCSCKKEERNNERDNFRDSKDLIKCNVCVCMYVCVCMCVSVYMIYVCGLSNDHHIFPLDFMKNKKKITITKKRRVTFFPQQNKNQCMISNKNEIGASSLGNKKKEI